MGVKGGRYVRSMLVHRFQGRFYFDLQSLVHPPRLAGCSDLLPIMRTIPPLNELLVGSNLRDHPQSWMEVLWRANPWPIPRVLSYAPAYA